jgi:hypothetical protein
MTLWRGGKERRAYRQRRYERAGDRMAEDDVSKYTTRKKKESREGEEEKKDEEGEEKEREREWPLASVEFAHAAMEKAGLMGLRSVRSRPFDSGRRRLTDWTI